ncbi:MAG: hypothetical protein H7Y27_13795 [Gemmatimonadaceae bacterium]|nr:hypothetical protein [Chitinophagaceae bacterium]
MKTPKNKIKKTPQVTIVTDMPDYRNEPVFKRKIENARAFLKEHPLPPEDTKRKH